MINTAKTANRIPIRTASIRSCRVTIAAALAGSVAVSSSGRGGGASRAALAAWRQAVDNTAFVGGPAVAKLEAILYVAWAERGWHEAGTVTPLEIDPWLEKRPVYGWYGDVDIDPRYLQERVPGLPGIARIVGVQSE